LCLQSQGFFDENTRLSVSILAYPPDRRKRDLDNVLKSLLDALMHAGVYSDDSQIDKLTISRNKPLDGRVIVSIDTLSEEGIKNN
jgi:crossover junction endodeoxyribonuclease RusA